MSDNGRHSDADIERERSRLRHDYLKRTAPQRTEADERAVPALDKAKAVWK